MPSTFYFAGRNWVSPATMSTTNTSALQQQTPTISGSVLALIGNCTGGTPGMLMKFTDPMTAAATLVSGELCQAVVKAFNTSTEDAIGAPSVVYAIRVNPATASTLALKDSSGVAQINLTSIPVGAQSTLVNVSVAAGSLAGYMVTTAYGQKSVTQDNIARNAISMAYGGTGTAAVSVTGANMVLTVTPVTGSPVVTTITFAQFPTYQDVVNYINSVTGWTASVLNGNGTLASANTLDYATSVAVAASPVVFTANLQAVVDYLNSAASPFVTAVRAAGVGAALAYVNAAYMTGGTDTSATNTQWANALNLLQGADVQWVTVLTGTQSILAMCDAHCQYMSTTGRSERRAINGTIAGTTDAQAETAAQLLNSNRSSLLHIGYYDYDVNNSGNLILLAPYMTAALVAAAFAGMTPGSAMTNKTLNVQGLERYLRNPDDTDPLLLAGVCPVEKDADGTFRVTQSITTWLTDNNEANTKVSVRCALDVTARTVRDAVDGDRGNKGRPSTMADALSRADTALTFLATDEPLGPGVLVGDATSPAFTGLTVSINGNVMPVTFQCRPVDCIDYIPVSIYAQPYSGTVSL